MSDVLKDVRECVASGWTLEDICEELGIDEREAARLMRQVDRDNARQTLPGPEDTRRDYLKHLTGDQIILGILEWGSVGAWAKALGTSWTWFNAAIVEWRRGVSSDELRRVRRELSSFGLHHRSIRAVVGTGDLPAAGEHGGALTRADRIADAAFIARWGHV